MAELSKEGIPMRVLTTFVSMCVAAACVAACGSGDEPAGTSGRTVTWHQDIAPLVTEKCVGCHDDGGIAPFSMRRYGDVFQFARGMAEQTASGAMPPFLAEDTDECVPRYGWAGDLRLTSAK